MSKSQLKYFIYCRKSTESEDRQILSLPAQKRELKEFAKKNNLRVVGLLSESASAYKLGREKFAEMLARIKKGEANGILVWAYNRLARNAIDGGQIIHLLDTESIKEIKTPSGSTNGSGNSKFMLQLEFAMSKKTSDDNSEAVKRGNREKILRGWDIRKHAGYMYIDDEKTLEKILVPDPDRFDLLQRAIYLVIDYMPVQDVLKTLNEDWGYLTPKTRRQGGKPLSLSNFYKILHDEFYSGWLFTDDNEKVKGKHKKMITDTEFDKIQEILGERGKPRPKSINLPFRSQIYCGECGCTVCLEEKFQCICSECKHKFASKNRDYCPKCKTPISKMDNPKHLHYIYARCSKKRKYAKCKEKSITLGKLIKQLAEYLSNIELSPKVEEWVLRQLEKRNQSVISSQIKIRENLQKQIDECQAKLDSLLVSYTSPENKSHELFSPEEYLALKAKFQNKKKALEKSFSEALKQSDNYMEVAEEKFNFAITARQKFEKGDYRIKTGIIRDLGSNPTLKDQKITIDQDYPWLFIKKAKTKLDEIETRGFEPEKMIDVYEKTGVLNPVISTLQAH